MARRFTRRDVLQRAAVVGTATAVPAHVLAQAARPAEAFTTLTASEGQILEAIVARLIPADELGPGALEAGAARYIDRSLSGALAASLETYRAGFAALDAYARLRHGRPFVAIEPEQQDDVLGAFEQDAVAPGAAAFFELVRDHTIEGTFCDPRYGGNRDFIGWELVGYPGLRLAVGPEAQRMSAKLELSRVSAYDLPMFDDDGSPDDD